MTLSIVMCTYNGEKYIIEQLDSIRTQRRQADEVLIFDDNSTDNTVRLIKDYIYKWKLMWKLRVNERNKGWERNFTDGFMEAKGDIIFCADQDDIWYPDKIEKMSEALLSHDYLLLGCKVNMVDEKGNNIHVYLGQMPRSKESGTIYSIRFDEGFYTSREPGCAIAFKRELLEYYRKYWEPNYPHDQLLWNISIALGKAAEIDRILIDYRRSSKSVFVQSSSKRSTKKRIQKIISTEIRIDTINRMMNEMKIHSKQKKRIVQKAKRWIKYRKKLVIRQNLLYGFVLLTYIKYYMLPVLYLVDIYDSLLGRGQYKNNV